MLKNRFGTDKAERMLFVILFFFLCSFFGWLWEVAIFWYSHIPHPALSDAIHSYRGVLHGPWLPIYGTGGFLVLVIKNFYYKKPIVFFSITMVASGIIEYVTSWALEMMYHARWWDYSKEFMNINGRICLMGLVVFGMIGTIFAYVIEPFLYRMIRKIPLLGRFSICMVLVSVFAVDVINSFVHPNLGVGVECIIR